MRIVHRISAHWFAGVALSFTLAACGGGQASPSTAASPAPSSAAASGAGSSSAAAKPSTAASASAAAAKPSTAASASAGASGAAASGSSAAPASAGAPAQMRKANLAWATLTPLFLAPHVGVEAGIYQKHGIDLTLTYTQNGPAAMAALVGGDVQFAELADPSVTTSALQGAGVEWVAINVPIPNLVLWTHPTINSVQELKGKKIGVTTLGSVTALFANLVLQQNGLQPQKDVQVIAIGGPAQAEAAIQKGEIDATVGDPNGPLAAEGQKILVDMRKGYAFPQAGIAVTKTFAQKDPQLVQDFVTALVESTRRAKSDEALFEQIDTKYLKRSDPAVVKDEVGGAIPVMNDDVTPNAKEIQTVLDMISSTNAKAKTANPQDFFDDSFAKKALQQAAK